MDNLAVKLKAYSKINLSLNILGILDDMHALDMVVASVNLADVISVSLGKSGSNIIEFTEGRDVKFPCGFKENQNTTVHKAVELLSPYLNGYNLAVHIEKNIPFSAGLGGSGASAAGVIKAVDRLLSLSEKGIDLSKIALKIGSDMPYQLEGGFARVQGIGEDVSFFNSPCSFDIVIAKDKNGVNTKESYAQFDLLNSSKSLVLNDNFLLAAALGAGDKTASIVLSDNALERGSCILEPQILQTKTALIKSGAIKAVMTGSGSAVTGFFENTEQASAAAKQLKLNGLEAYALKTLPRGIEFIN